MPSNNLLLCVTKNHSYWIEVLSRSDIEHSNTSNPTNLPVQKALINLNQSYSDWYFCEGMETSSACEKVIPFFFLPSQLHCSSPSLHRITSPKWLTPSFHNMHSWRHPGRAKMLCMLYKMIHKYTTDAIWQLTFWILNLSGIQIPTILFIC